MQAISNIGLNITSGIYRKIFINEVNVYENSQYSSKIFEIILFILKNFF